MNIWNFMTIYVAIGWAVSSLGVFVDDRNVGLVKTFNETAKDSAMSQKALSAIYTLVVFVVWLFFVVGWPTLIPSLPFYVSEGFDMLKAKLKRNHK